MDTPAACSRVGVADPCLAIIHLCRSAYHLEGHAGPGRYNCAGPGHHHMGGSVRHYRRQALSRHYRQPAVFWAGQGSLGAFRIWEGGLGIWGAVALGLVGAAIGARRTGIRLATFADAAAPGLLLAQGLGRWGNWFNNELYGEPTDLPWKLQIHAMNPATGQAVTAADGAPEILGYFQPTFLYESLWCVAAASLLILLDRRYKLGAGSVFALYTAGRLAFELMRSDYANTIMGLRVNTWVSALLFLAGLGIFLVLRSRPRSEATAGSTGSVDAVGLRMDGHPSVPRRGTQDGKSEQHRER